MTTRFDFSEITNKCHSVGYRTPICKFKRLLVALPWLLVLSCTLAYLEHVHNRFIKPVVRSISVETIDF